MANFFIERPVFARVLAIIMMFTGGIAIMNLPIAQYPQIAPHHYHQRSLPRCRRQDR